MLQLALAALAVAAVFFAFRAPASTKVAFVKIVSSASGPRLQYLDRQSEDPAVREAVLKLAEAEGRYTLADEKKAVGEKGANYFSLTGKLDPAATGPKLSSRMQAITAGTTSYTLMRFEDADAILAGNPPATIEFRVITDPEIKDRALVAEGQPWFVFQMTSKTS